MPEPHEGPALPDPPSPTLAAVHAARERTLARGSARVAVATELTFEWSPSGRRRRGGIARPLLAVGKALGTRLWQALPGASSWRRQEAEGFVDLAGRRFMLDYGSYARLHADGREWAGRAGRALSTLGPGQRERIPAPLWLLDLLAGAIRAEEEGTEEVRSVPCRRVRVQADLGRASRATPGGMHAPEMPRFEDLLALTVHVWLAEDGVRRVRCTLPGRTETIELWDPGVSLEGLDWSRLPGVRSPG